MAGVVGELLVSGVVKVAAGKLAVAVGEQVSLWRNHERDLNAMKDHLALVQAVLRAAEKRSFTDDAVCRWLQQLKAVAYDISDTLDDAQFGDDSPSSSLMERFKAANKINKLKKKLKKVVERRTIFGFDLPPRLADEEEILKKVVEQRETVSYIDHKSTIVGRSEEIEEIIELLLKEEGTTILPIVGIGGMGKTILAKLIFNDNKMKDFNGRKAWVYVSQKFDLIKIGNDVISELGGANESCNNRQSVFKCLKNKMTDGKFLIVLDDLWEEDVEQLDSLKLMLQPEKSQITMKIIVTTRTEAIAQKMCTHDTFHIKPLSDDNCWTVFKLSAFSSTEFSIAKEDELEKIGWDIAKKCKGLPLAAHAVGSMLRSKSIDFWKAIRDSDTWNEADTKVLPSLKLSYDHMPSHLKQCFAYCAIFPKGFSINKDELIQQWIALGFIQPFPSNLSHNSQAEQQVQELLKLSFLQNSIISDLQNSISYFSSPKDIDNIAKAPQGLSMHDLVHDLATWVSGDETLTLDATKKNKGSNERRHVVVVNYDEGQLSKSLPVNVRALHFRGSSGTQLPNNAFSSTRHVRVLDISGYAVGRLSNSVPQLASLRYLDASRLQDKELPKWITKLLKLQYFRIHHSFEISKLPESVGNLKDLVHLDLSGCQRLVELPESVGNLKDLVHLDLSGCERLVELPESVGNLKDLVHLNLSICTSLVKLPESIGNLKDLVHLNLSICTSLVKLPESVGNLKDLRHLDLSRCGWFVEVSESICNLKDLRHLDLSRCGSLVELPESVGNLKDLRHLDLSNCGSLVKFPESVGNLKDLRHLNLSWCGRLVDMPESVGNLKYLRHLDLSSCGSLVKLPESVGNLKDLRHLNLSSCGSLVKLPESVGNLKDLRHLNLSSCGSLVKLPESVGNLKDLRRLNLSWCKSLVELPESVCNLKDLRHLDLSSCGSLAQLPKSIGNLKDLRHLDLSKCGRLVEVPKSVGNLKDLEHLDLSLCERFVELPESVGNLKDLRHLNLSWCRSLVELPESVGNLKDLRYLNLSRCVSLVELPESVGNLKDLVHLDLSRCGSLVELPESVGNLKDLVHLDLSRCGSLVELPESVGNLKDLRHLDLSWCESLIELPKSVGNVKDLAYLNMSLCSSLIKLPESVGNLKILRRLDLVGCENFVELPESFQDLRNLEYLYLLCWDLEELLPLGQLLNLKELTLRGMKNIKKLGKDFCGGSPAFSKLKKFELLYMKGLEEWSTVVSAFGENEAEFMFPNLEHLHIRGCPMLSFTPCPPRATVCRIWGSDKVISSCARHSFSTLITKLSVGHCDVPEGEWRLLDYLPRLHCLQIMGCHELKNLPTTIQGLSSLQELEVHNCDGLVQLPEWLGELASLRSLAVSRWAKLMSLPQCIQQLEKQDLLKFDIDGKMFISTVFKWETR